jgi:membrane protein implicated in regulation of membrane protease activity
MVSPTLPAPLPLILLVVGVGLCIAEAVAPGANIIVLGVALLAAGLVGLFVPAVSSPLALGVLVFAFGAGALFVYRKLDIYGGKGSGRTSDSSSLVGARGTVTDRVTMDTGTVELRRAGFDSTYSARTTSGELPRGTEVVVVDPGGGSVLTVQRVEDADIDADGRDDANRSDDAGV